MEKAVTSTKPGKSLYVILSLFSWLLLSCQDNPHPEKQGFSDVFYDEPNGKLWGHRINDPENANKWLKNFSGVELDVVYDWSSGRFNIRHDVEAETSPYFLDDYIDQLENPQEAYLWIDFKNLSWLHIEDIAEKLEELLTSRNMKDRCIIESFNSAELFELNKKGFYTSYWVPHLYVEATKEDTLKCLETLRMNFEKYQFNAMSAHHPMLDFLTKHYPDKAVHLWTNGLVEEWEKEVIKEFSAKENVKVILVDYEDNFIK